MADDDNTRGPLARLEQREKRNRWPFLLAALAAIVLVVLLAKACSDRGPDDAIIADNTADKTITATRPAVVATPRPYIRGQLAAYLAGTEPLPYSYELANVTFDSGSAKLVNAAGEEIADIAAALRARSTARVSVRGYADPEGAADANQKLSQERAEAVRDALVKGGADSGQIALAALGETGAAATRANRKVELTATAR